MRVLNAQQMREADRQTIEEIGIPSLVLMENAGRQIVAAMEAAFEDLATLDVVVLCGRGNNGGDGFVVARTLHQRGVEVSVALIGHVSDVRGDARVNLEILGRLGIEVIEITNAQEWELHYSRIARCGLIVDALFGTGLKEPLGGLLATIVADVNSIDMPVVAVDLPSGLLSDTHEVSGEVVEATLTVTLGAPKISLILPPAESRVGDLVIADIGIPAAVIAGLDGPSIEILTRDEMRGLVQPRVADSHKGDFGRVLIVAGSAGKTGAAHLAARAALRSGAGLVTVATPRSCWPVVAALSPEYMTEPLDETPGGAIDFAALERALDVPADVIALGPGLGQDPSTVAFVHSLLDRSGVPLIIDADGLNAFGDSPDRLRGRDGLSVIITPHPGEMARLMGVTTDHVQATRLETARAFAMAHQVYVVLKGHRTLIATPEGRVSVNLTGNPGMATGGTGDALTGMIAAWLAQLLDPETACKLAVYLHGTAGDLAEADEGEVAMIAGDVIDRLGDALLELTARRRIRPDQTPS
ncbi:MAG: NAD(P)H-hydrate dehydratase [Acidobacteria bacterium]|nr:NAD(P)H-hydrate dehydratase [Acidobacteriota bacterium]